MPKIMPRRMTDGCLTYSPLNPTKMPLSASCPLIRRVWLLGQPYSAGWWCIRIPRACRMTQFSHPLGHISLIIWLVVLPILWATFGILFRQLGPIPICSPTNPFRVWGTCWLRRLCRMPRLFSLGIIRIKPRQGLVMKCMNGCRSRSCRW